MIRCTLTRFSRPPTKSQPVGLVGRQGSSTKRASRRKSNSELPVKPPRKAGFAGFARSKPSALKVCVFGEGAFYGVSWWFLLGFVGWFGVSYGFCSSFAAFYLTSTTSSLFWERPLSVWRNMCLERFRTTTQFLLLEMDVERTTCFQFDQRKGAPIFIQEGDSGSTESSYIAVEPIIDAGVSHPQPEHQH